MKPITETGRPSSAMTEPASDTPLSRTAACEAVESIGWLVGSIRQRSEVAAAVVACDEVR